MDLERMKQECENNRLHYSVTQNILRQCSENIEGTAKLAGNGMFLVSGGSVIALLSFIAQKGAMPAIKTALACCVTSTLLGLLLLGVMYLQRYIQFFFLEKEINQNLRYETLSCWVYRTMITIIFALWLSSFGLLCFAAYAILTDPLVFNTNYYI